MLNPGERSVAMADPATTLRSVAKGNPLVVVYPTDGAVATLDPSGIIKDSKSPNAAKLFMEFLFSAENAKVISENFEQSLRPEVPPAPGAKSLARLLKAECGYTVRVTRKWVDEAGAPQCPNHGAMQVDGADQPADEGGSDQTRDAA